MSAPHSLAFFRIAFGALLLLDVVRMLQGDSIHAELVAPPFHFHYFGFEWVEPLPEPWLRRLVSALGVCCALIVVGWGTRIAAALFLLGFGYLFLLEQANYLNHFWLVLLLALLLAWIPTDGVWSVAARRRGRIEAVPRSALLLVRAQLAIVYGFAALAKCNGDWLHAQPLQIWFASRAGASTPEPLRSLLAAPATAWVASWGGLLVDLLVVPLLLVKRTRAAMFAVVVAFHLANALLFDIGIFPWLAIAATTVFFAPDWPLRLLRRPAPELAMPAPRRPHGAAIALWLAFQLFVPLRHLLYPGDVSWTEEGHRFAWRMKLRSKVGHASFVVTDPVTREQRIVDPRAELTERQCRKLAGHPDMLLQYAHYLAERFTVVDGSGSRRPQVRAITDCSLNGRAPQPLVDPDVDLAAQPRSLAPASWIVPLREPLPASGRQNPVDVDDG